MKAERYNINLQQDGGSGVRNKKKIFLSAAIFVLIGIIVVAACIFRHGKGKRNGTSADISVSQRTISYNYQGVSGYSEQGIVTIQEDGLIHFTDAVTKESKVICDKAGCGHEPYDKKNNPDPACDGYALGLQCILMVEDSLYFWGTVKDDAGKMQDIEIYRADLNGDHREKVATVPDSAAYCLVNSASDGRYLAIEYYAGYEERAGMLVETDQAKAGIIMVDLQDYSVADYSNKNMGIPGMMSFSDQRIYIAANCPYYSRLDELAEISDEELAEYLDSSSCNGMYIYNMELHRIAEHDLLTETGERRWSISPLVLSGDMAVFTEISTIILYQERKHRYESLYPEEGKAYKGRIYEYEPVCWKGSEIYCKDDINTEESVWMIYDTANGDMREMGTMKGKVIRYGLGKYLFGYDKETDSEFVLTEEEFFGTGAGN